MNGIEIMVEEHKYISRMLKVVRSACYKILNGSSVDYEDFTKVIEFIRNYADNHHHGKEEKFLFNRMVDEIGEVADKLINFGMLIEHDLGRLYIKNLEEALKRVKNGDDESRLDVIANAIGYTQLLTGHIEKEDNTIYTFANRQLSEKTLEIINRECSDYEKSTSEKNIQNKYIAILEDLEKKYI
ncbi:hemerythrin domain-containing protein [Clostridium cylindrosporum]|uniref:Hemerythrin-like domain-containing protein n=1 Tax=Clostridium cylindrosporum DSM 605 TaxID=1121307 RepID=A0A0J8D9L2_CLOCY|nr:hemerythrin domain-containing protein [Clostridium cylindrosporum]KMT20993.1 hypothetical protein CLCY_1c02270 [Clostridium cylindrosporum DSM 605]